MSSRPTLIPYSVITAASLAAPITSSPTIITNISMICYEVSWTGNNPQGAIAVQVSNSYSVNSAGGVVLNANPTWTTLILSAPTNVSGNSGSGIIQLSDVPAHAIRLVYTPTSGTGTLNAIIAGKVE